MNEPNLITRKELACNLRRPYDWLRRNEKHLGLDQCRVQVNARVLFFREDLVVKALVKVGLLVVSNGTMTYAEWPQ